MVIVGNSSVGKSSILRRFADDSFQESYLATIGVDFRFKYNSSNEDQLKIKKGILNYKYGIQLDNSDFVQ